MPAAFELLHFPDNRRERSCPEALERSNGRIVDVAKIEDDHVSPALVESARCGGPGRDFLVECDGSLGVRHHFENALHAIILKHRDRLCCTIDGAHGARQRVNHRLRCQWNRNRKKATHKTSALQRSQHEFPPVSNQSPPHWRRSDPVRRERAKYSFRLCVMQERTHRGLCNREEARSEAISCALLTRTGSRSRLRLF